MNEPLNPSLIVPRSLLTKLVFVLLMVPILAGCSTQPVDSAGATIIDVRTPEEYAEGHLKDAVNIDYQSASFEQELATLDKEGRYILYCRSGRRAGEALTLMESLGFTQVENAGGMDQASQATGLPVVQ